MMTGTGDLRSDIRSNEESNVIALQLKALEVAAITVVKIAIYCGFGNV